MLIPTHCSFLALSNRFIAPQSGIGETAPLHHQIKPTFSPPLIARMPVPQRSRLPLLYSQQSADENPPSAGASTGTPFQRLQQLGSIAIVNGGAEGPTPIAMDLLALGFGRSVAIACDDTPPNLLNDFPADITNVVATKQVGAVAAADTMFLLECSTLKTIQNAKYIKPQGRVVIAGGELHRVAEQVAVLHKLRPDVAIFGHAASEFALYAPSAVADPVQACHALATILDGEAALMVRPLHAEDTAWISEKIGTEIKAGNVIAAPFSKEGYLDRPQCNALLESAESGLRETILQLAALQGKPLLVHSAAISAAEKECNDVDTIHRARRVPGIAPDAAEVDRRVAALGPTVVYGANGSIGSALLKSLAESGTPLCGVMRKPDREFLRGFDSPLFDLVIAAKVPDHFAARTAFITASTGWPKDAAGKIIFDRSRLLSANIAILTPIFMQLPEALPLVMVISNPCSEMAYLGWLVRPDLSRALYAHAGTDVTRQMNRVKNPRDTSQYGTAGPHSPMQVNWEMTKNRVLHAAAGAHKPATDAAMPDANESANPSGRIDPRIPLLGQVHQSRSRDKNSVTVPSAAAGIFEAVNIVSNVPQSYARPLTRKEAEQMTTVMQQHGQKMSVNEGIAPTLPRDAGGEIRWDMLHEALDGVPNFSKKLFAALNAMEEGRSGLLSELINKINQGRADHEKIDSDWIIAHRGPVLAEAIVSAQKR